MLVPEPAIPACPPFTWQLQMLFLSSLSIGLVLKSGTITAVQRCKRQGRTWTGKKVRLLKEYAEYQDTQDSSEDCACLSTMNRRCRYLDETRRKSLIPEIVDDSFESS
jgi:hypothetical protein